MSEAWAVTGTVESGDGQTGWPNPRMSCCWLLCISASLSKCLVPLLWLFTAVFSIKEISNDFQ